MFAASKTNSASTGGYQISRSLRFNSDDSAYLTRTPASAGNRKTWTYSTWIKRSNVATNQYLLSNLDTGGASGLGIQIPSTGVLHIFDYGASNYVYELSTLAVFRDPSAWYHIVLAFDTTQATSSNRVKLYVNNVQQTAFDIATYPTLNYDGYWNNTSLATIGRAGGLNVQYFNGYQTEVNFIDGQALTPSSFGQTDAQTGVWQPKAYSGSYGTNGFYLNFSDNSNTTAATLGKDYSGNGNNWTPNNFSVTAGAGNDSLVDSPTSYGTDTGVGGTVRSNYATLNPLSNPGSSTLSNGNLDCVTSAGNAGRVVGTTSMSSGKWYWEYSKTAANTYSLLGGIAPDAEFTSVEPGRTASSYGYYGGTGQKYNNATLSSYGASYTNGDIIGVALDMDAGTLTFYKNGVSQGVAFSGLTGSFVPAISAENASSISLTVNFGQRPFAYTAPSGYKALCTQNLPTPTIGATTATQASKFFAPVLYSGNGASSRAVTGVGFQPDFVWLKVRNYAFVNGLWDSVRGGGKLLISNLTLAEITNDPNGYVSSFDSDGFTLTAGTTNNDTFNGSANSMVSWNWKANGSGSTNTSGSITSTVSANTTSGFSVVTYAGNSVASTIGHGLGVAPSMIIVKNRTTSSPGAWTVYHASLGNTSLMFLNTSDAVYTGNTAWNSTSPTSSVFSVGSGTLSVNNTGNNFVAYCFAEISGFSKIGSWVGNGSTDGPFVYCGFRPAFLLVKNTGNGSQYWDLYDNKRNTYNPENLRLFPNASDAENTSLQYDFLSNGFKVRSSDFSSNESGKTFIFIAFAENPFKYSLAR